MTNEKMYPLEMYLEARIKNMRIFINEPRLVYQLAYTPISLPPISIGEISTQEELSQFNRINELLAEFNECEEKILGIVKASELVGERVHKNTKKPFQSGKHVVTVKEVIIHPYRPGWYLSYTFEEDNSSVGVDQVRKFNGN